MFYQRKERRGVKGEEDERKGVEKFKRRKRFFVFLELCDGYCY